MLWFFGVKPFFGWGWGGDGAVWALFRLGVGRIDPLVGRIGLFAERGGPMTGSFGVTRDGSTTSMVVCLRQGPRGVYCVWQLVM